MTMDFVAERLGHANFAELQEIDLPHCDLRTIDVGNGEVFRNLRRCVQFCKIVHTKYLIWLPFVPACLDCKG